MTKQMEDYAVCVSTALINKYEKSQDKRDEAFKYVYDKTIHLFKNDLENCECQEDINDDLIFEVGYIIDRDSWDVEREEIVKAIYSDYNIKGAE